MNGRYAQARIPNGHDPALIFLLSEIRNRLYVDPPPVWLRIETRAGVGEGTLRRWMYAGPGQRGPSICTVRAGLNALGYDLAIVPLERDEGVTNG